MSDTNSAATQFAPIDFLAEYRQPWWLKSPFGGNALLADFGSGYKLEIDFNIKLPDGSSLASPQNTLLRCDIFDFICIQSQHAVGISRRRARSPQRERRHVVLALHIADYFLLRAESLQLHQYGFRALATTHISEFLSTVSQSQEVVESLYDWRRLLTQFLRYKGALLDEDQLASLTEELPELTIDGIEQSGRILELTDEELYRARAYIYTSGNYRPNQAISGAYDAVASSFAAQIYRNTLYGRTYLKSWRTYPELSIGFGESYIRECAGVPVRTTYTDDRCSEDAFEQYRQKLLTCQPLAALGMGIPAATLERAARALCSEFGLKPAGRTARVPPHVVAECLRRAVDYFYDHGEHLIASLDYFISAACGAANTPHELNARLGIVGYLHPESVAIGINCWMLTREPESPLLSARQLSAKLRNEKSALYEMVNVLFGAMLLIVGVIVAPRQAEILDLEPGDMNEMRTWLTILTRKTGYDGVRYRDEKPIPKVAADVISLLTKYAEARTDFSEVKKLFALPNALGKARASEAAANSAIDAFLDFIEAPKDKLGRRYYLRQHQLRAFLPTAYLYSSTVGGIDDMAWMLGHADKEHIWHYITNTTPGGVLEAAKANASSLMVLNGAPGTEQLQRFLVERLGAQTFTAMDEDSLADYIADLVADNTITVEPLFFALNGATSMRLGITVHTNREDCDGHR